MLNRLRSFISRRGAPVAPIELTVVDQWVLKTLFLAGNRPVDREAIVQSVLIERPELLSLEVDAALFRMQRAGFVSLTEAGYLPARSAGALRSVIPNHPTTNLDYYG